MARSTRGELSALTFAAVVTVLLLTSLGRVSGTATAASVRPGDVAAPTTELVIDPDSWWMPAGNVSAFGADWVDPGPACSVAPLWFRWSIPTVPAGGSLAPSSGPSVNFTAEPVASGTTVLQVRSAAVIRCGSNESLALSTARANVTVIAPLQVQNVSVQPNPVAPGQATYLRGDVVGGEPPYTFRVAWGDGTESQLVVAGAGSFEFPHAFGPGTFSPSLVVNDSSGWVAESSVEETVTVSSSLAVGIAPVRFSTDVNTSLGLVASLLHANEPLDTAWTCNDLGRPLPATAGAGSRFACVFPAPGTGQVFFQAVPRPPGMSATAFLYESVVPLPTLAVQTANVTGEVGVPTSIGFTVAGGVAPFTLEWQITGRGPSGRLSVPTDGTVLVSMVPTMAGAQTVIARLVDADGVTTVNSSESLQVEPALAVQVATASEVNRTGAQVGFDATVTAGVPPFYWAVVPGLSSPNSTLGGGVLDSVGSFAWSGFYPVEGALELSVIVIDATGAMVTLPLEIPTVPSLEATFGAWGSSVAGPGHFRVEVNVTGGAPPFGISIAAADGETWERTAASDGRFDWDLSTSASGGLPLGVSVTDAFGAVAEWNGSAIINGTGGASGFGDAATMGVLTLSLGAGLCAVALALLRRSRHRRSSRVEPVVPDPVGVLRDIVAPADGADRATVELLAEEAGVPLPLVRSTLDRLILDGTIRSDSEGDDGEVISWSSVPPD
jgi:hypothetical protein